MKIFNIEIRGELFEFEPKTHRVQVFEVTREGEGGGNYSFNGAQVDTGTKYLLLIDGSYTIENGRAEKKERGGGGVEWSGYGVRGGERTLINEAGRRRVRNKTGGGNARGM